MNNFVKIDECSGVQLIFKLTEGICICGLESSARQKIYRAYLKFKDGSMTKLSGRFCCKKCFEYYHNR